MTLIRKSIYIVRIFYVLWIHYYNKIYLDIINIIDN